MDYKLVLSEGSNVAESDLNIIKQIFNGSDSSRFAFLCNKILIDNNSEIPGTRYVEIRDKIYSCGLPEIVVVIGNYVE